MNTVYMKFTRIKITRITVHTLRSVIFFILGELKTKGIVIPTTKDIYVPILEKLKEDGIEAKTVQL